jgi:hypothetical protein
MYQSVVVGALAYMVNGVTFTLDAEHLGWIPKLRVLAVAVLQHLQVLYAQERNLLVPQGHGRTPVVK